MARKVKAKCIICKKTFKPGDEIQAFLRSPDDPVGGWTKPIILDSKFQERHQRNQDKVKRKHFNCNQ